MLSLRIQSRVINGSSFLRFSAVIVQRSRFLQAHNIVCVYEFIIIITLTCRMATKLVKV